MSVPGVYPGGVPCDPVYPPLFCGPPFEEPEEPEPLEPEDPPEEPELPDPLEEPEEPEEPELPEPEPVLREPELDPPELLEEDPPELLEPLEVAGLRLAAAWAAATASA